MSSSRLALAALFVFVNGCDDHQDSADHPVLAGTEPAPSGACPHGGTRVLSGLDLDGNGVLDASEATVAHDVCADAPPAPGAVVRIDAELPGPRCPRGGTAVRSGLDRNHDGVLTDDEVSAVDYLCRGQTLIDVERLEHITGCPDGGVAIHTGQDEDGNGVLDRSEITSTRTECSDAVTGDAFIRNAADVAGLAHVKVVTGSLFMFGDGPTQLVLPDLELVGGEIKITGALRLASLSIPRLQRVGSMLTIKNNPDLKEIVLSGLADVADLIDIGLDPKLERISLPALRRVGAGLDLSGNASLAQIELGSLLEVGGDVQIRSALALGKLDLSQLHFVTGISIIDDRALTQLQLAHELRAAHVEISANPLLTSLDLGAVEALNELTVQANDKLAILALPTFTRDRVVIRDNAALTELVVVPSSAATLEVHNNGLAKLTLQLGHAGASATIDSNPNLHALAVSGERAHNLIISGNPGLVELSISVPELDTCSVSGDHIAHLAFPSLAHATVLQIDAPLETLELPTPRPAVPGLVMVDTIGIEDLPLEEMGTKTLELASNRKLTRVIAGELTGILNISDNPELVSVEMRGDSFGDVIIRGNAKLAAFAGLERVRSVSSLLIGSNAFKRVDMPALTSAAAVMLSHDTAFDAIDLHNLVTAVDLLVLGHGVVEPPRLDALRHASTVRIAGTSLASVSFPRLSDARALQVTDNDQLGELSFPLLTQLVQATVTDNPVLDVCKIEALFAATHAQAHEQTGNRDTGGCP